MSADGEQHPKVAIVSSIDIALEGGVLRADYWCDRLPGESWEAWQLRGKVAHLEELAAWHEEQAAARRAEAAALREGGTR